jgi:signal transduction histidine kinase
VQPGLALELDRRPTDLVALTRQVVGEIPQGSAGGHEIVVEAAEPELVGEWDATRIERVLSNLVGNALKYSPSGGRIRLGLERDVATAEAVLRVEDAGMGIPKDELPRVFDRFYRGRNVVGKIPGTGIGLAGVRLIVEQHGGRVSVESTEGVGTTFTVRLPLDLSPVGVPALSS